MRTVRARWGIAGAAFLALVLGVLVWHDAHRQHLLHPGDRLVPLSLSSINGSPLTLVPARRPQIINVFATWCTPCREETPGLVAVAARLKRAGVAFVGIDQEESPAQVDRFAKEFALPYPVYIDTTGITHYVLGARMIPTTIYVGADGVIRWVHAGPLSAGELLALARAARND